MNRFHQEITIPCMVMIVALLEAFALLSGCAAVHKHEPTVPGPDRFEQMNASRCKIVGKKKGLYSTVLVRKDCLRQGVTEVTIILHVHKDKYFKSLSRKNLLKIAVKGMEESYHSMVKILGFKPKLASMGIVRMGNVPCYLFIVTGISD